MISVDPVTKETIIFAFLFWAYSILEFIAVRKKWTFFVDPPEEWSWNSYSRLKKLFGKDFLIGFHCFSSIALFIIGTILLILLITRYLGY